MKQIIGFRVIVELDQTGAARHWEDLKPGDALVVGAIDTWLSEFGDSGKRIVLLTKSVEAKPTGWDEFDRGAAMREWERTELGRTLHQLAMKEGRRYIMGWSALRAAFVYEKAMEAGYDNIRRRAPFPVDGTLATFVEYADMLEHIYGIGPKVASDLRMKVLGEIGVTYDG